MKLEYTDFIPKLQELYPDVKKESLERIIKEGLKGLLRYLRTGNDVIIKTALTFEGYENFWFKFYTPIPMVGQQYAKAKKDLEFRGEERPRIAERNKKWKKKSQQARRNGKVLAKKFRKRKVPKKVSEMTEEEYKKFLKKRRKQLRAARKRRIERDKNQQANDDK
jgi:hypothetical protein